MNQAAEMSPIGKALLIATARIATTRAALLRTTIICLTITLTITFFHIVTSFSSILSASTLNRSATYVLFKE